MCALGLVKVTIEMILSFSMSFRFEPFRSEKFCFLNLKYFLKDFTYHFDLFHLIEVFESYITSQGQAKDHIKWDS